MFLTEERGQYGSSSKRGGGASQLIDWAETLMSGGADAETAEFSLVGAVDELVRVSLEGWRQAEDVSSTAIRTFKEVLVFLSLYLAWNRIAASTPFGRTVHGIE
jgi:hypothetical protein